jgi:ubiquinone biosynthesis protein UbiJ
VRCVKLTVAHDGEGKGRVARRALSLFWLGRAQEKTELEEQRVALVGEVQSYRTKIKQLEDDLLFRLSNSQARRPGDWPPASSYSATHAKDWPSVSS